MNKRTPAVLLFCACASLLGTAQAAGTLIGQVGVQMVIGAGCTIINGSVSGGINQWGTLDFGSHSDLTNVVDAQTVGTSGNIQIQCSTGLTPSLTVNAGLHASGGQRYMQNTTTTTSTIAYNIYSDAARSASRPTHRWTSPRSPPAPRSTSPLWPRGAHRTKHTHADGGDLHRHPAGHHRLVRRAARRRRMVLGDR